MNDEEADEFADAIKELTRNRAALDTRPVWHVEDCRTGRRAGIASYPSKASAEAAIERWRERDLRGGRPDIHELMPYLVAVEG